MRANLDRRFSAAEAARLALADAVGESSPAPVRSAREAHRSRSTVSTRVPRKYTRPAVRDLTLDVVLRDVLVPYLHDSGSVGRARRVSVAGALREQPRSRAPDGLARFWDRRGGPAGVDRLRRGRAPRPASSQASVSCSAGTAGGSATSGRTLPSPRSWTRPRRSPLTQSWSRGLRAGRVRPITTRLREVAVHAPLYVSGAAATGRIASGPTGRCSTTTS